MRPKPARALRPLALLATVFCCVSGGPYGLEPLFQASGAGLGLVLLLLVPVVWALPDALTTAELAAAIPEEGGYVVWVKRALGPFAGFVNGWWTWLYTLVDAAIYPVLFREYLDQTLYQFWGVDWLRQGPWPGYLVSLGVIAAFTWLNVRGTRLVGAASGVFMAVLVLPFLALAVAGFWRLATDPRPIVGSFLPEGVGLGAGLAGGLGIVLWNYLGWDQLSTVAEEVEEPQRAYPMAMLVGVPLVTLVYLLPVLPSLAFFPDTSLWEDGSWPQIAQAVAGPGLALVVALAALVSPAALFTASLLGSSRIPFVLAADRFLPRSLVAVHPRFGTPHRAILVCAACYALLAWRDFTTLVTVNVVLYAAALSMEAVSLAVLRRKEPTLVRPFRVPGGRLGVGLVVALPILVLVALVSLTVAEEGWASQCWTMAALASGPIVYGLVRKSQRP